MKKILFNSIFLVINLIILTGCFYGSCADWNCNYPNPHWEKAVDTCSDRNFEIVKQQFGYKDYREVVFSEIGQKIQISYKCRINDGRYDVREDKEYRNLFMIKN